MKSGNLSKLVSRGIGRTFFIQMIAKFPILFLLLGLSTGISAHGADRFLYVTDFEDFPVGEDRLVGVDGWVGTHAGQTVHGIDDGAAPDLGKTGFLGANRPPSGTELVSIYRPLAPDVAPATGEVRFNVLFGITSSFSGGDDRFSFSILNSNDEFLAAIVFDTSDANFGVWTDDGVVFNDTGELFFTEYLHVLTANIDLERNVWTADLDGILIFDSIPFTGTNIARNVATVAAEWEIDFVDDPGDNWLLFDDWSLVSLNEPEPVLGEEFRINSISIEPDGGRLLRWSGVNNTLYRVQHSGDGTEWMNDLPGSEVSAAETGTTLSFVDRSIVTEGVRYYRVIAIGDR